MIRGLWTHGGVLYSVENQYLYSISSTGVTTRLRQLNSTGGNVDFASNLTQLVINDGSYLYVYTPSSGNFATAVGYTGGDRISFLDQRINFQMRGTQQFGWTSAGDASTIDALDFASAESSPDLLVSHLASNRELVLVGEDSTEIWDAVGGTDVYQRTSAAIDYGCLAPFTLQKSANSSFWLGKDGRGQAMVLQLQGHQVKRISTRAEEEKFEGITLSSATAFTYSDGGQSFYCLNIPALNTTLTFDETYGEWHERAEWRGSYAKWRPTCHALAYGKNYFGGVDSTGTPALYVADRTVNNYGGDPKRRVRIAPVISKPTMVRVKYSEVELICEKGTGATVMLRFSDDNGYTWSNWQYTTVGTQGQWARRARWRRLGMAYDRVFEIVMADDKPFNAVQLNVSLK